MKHYTISGNYKDILTETINAMTWARDYCKEYQINGDFDPLAALSGTADRKQRLFGESVDYIENIRKATEDFINTRNIIIYRG